MSSKPKGERIQGPTSSADAIFSKKNSITVLLKMVWKLFSEKSMHFMAYDTSLKYILKTFPKPPEKD